MKKKKTWKTTRFTKSIATTPEIHKYLSSIKDRKSMAGKLEEIIEEYKKNKQKKL